MSEPPGKLPIISGYHLNIIKICQTNFFLWFLFRNVIRFKNIFLANFIFLTKSEFYFFLAYSNHMKLIMERLNFIWSCALTSFSRFFNLETDVDSPNWKGLVDGSIIWSRSGLAKCLFYTWIFDLSLGLPFSSDKSRHLLYVVLVSVRGWRLLVAGKRFRFQVWQHFHNFFVSILLTYFMKQDYSQFLQSVAYLKTVWNQLNLLWRTLTKFVFALASIKMIQVISAATQVSSSIFAIDYCQFAIRPVVMSSIFIWTQIRILPQI